MTSPNYYGFHGGNTYGPGYIGPPNVAQSGFSGHGPIPSSYSTAPRASTYDQNFVTAGAAVAANYGYPRPSVGHSRSFFQTPAAVAYSQDANQYSTTNATSTMYPYNTSSSSYPNSYNSAVTNYAASALYSHQTSVAQHDNSSVVYSSYNTNNTPYHPPKISGGNNIPASGPPICSCMHVAAAAANTNPHNAPVNYLQPNLPPTPSGDSEACLSSITPTISEAFSNSNMMDESQLDVDIDSGITSEPSMNFVFNGPEIEFSNLHFLMVEASAAANYAQQMRIDGTGPKRKKERTKKHKKKEKIKSIDRISMPTNTNANNQPLFPYHHHQPNSHYHESFSNHMNQNCCNFEQSHHQSPVHHLSPVHHQSPSHHHSPAPSHPSTPIHQQQVQLYAKSLGTPYPEPRSSVNQQQQQLHHHQQPQSHQQVPRNHASLSQNLPPNRASSNLSEAQSSLLQSQSNLMPQSDPLIPRVSPSSSCFGTSTALTELQSDLLNGSLNEQLHSAGSRHSNHSNHSAHSNQTHSTMVYPESRSNSSSQQPMIVHHNNTEDSTCTAPSNLDTSENNNHLENHISEGFSSIEDELDFLTAAEECGSTSQVTAAASSSSEIGTPAGSQIVSPNESHNIPMDQPSHQSQLQTQYQQTPLPHPHQNQPHQQPATALTPSVSPAHLAITAQTPPTPPLSSTPSSSLPMPSCLEQSKQSTPTAISLHPVNPILNNSCAISDSLITIKPAATTPPAIATAIASKGYQTDFIPSTPQQKVTTTPATVDIGVDVNNLENRIKNEIGGNIIGSVKKKKKSKDVKMRFFQQKSSLAQSSSPSPPPAPPSSCSNKKVNSMINIVPIHNDNFNRVSPHLNNKSMLSHVTTCKPIEVNNMRKTSSTGILGSCGTGGDLKDHEAKFFKMRPMANTTTITTIHKTGMKVNSKSTKKRKLEEIKEHKSVVDEYEFPDSPTHSMSTKKVKRVNLENSKKKISDKLITHNSGNNNTNNNNNCSLTINKKVSLKPKTKVNQNFTGNTASTKLNISEKTEIINIIGPRPTTVNPQLQCKKLEDKGVKPSGSLEKKHQQQQFNSNPNQLQKQIINSSSSSSHPSQTQRLNKDISKVPTITVQEILAPPNITPTSTPISSSSSTTTSNRPPTPKNSITSTINIVSISKKSPPIGSSNSNNNSININNTANNVINIKKESPTRASAMNHNPIPTNTLTTIVPVPVNSSNATINISSSFSITANLTTTTTITTQPHPNVQSNLPPLSIPTTSTQPQPQHQQQPHLIGSIKNITNQNVLMASAGTNTPRRRSQDKKALTIREGLMRTGDFVVSLEETKSDLPMIWRIEGKSLLQRFEPGDQDGQIVYTNTSSYSAWNPTVKQRYTGVDVRIVGCNRTKIVVEKLGLTRNNPNYDKLDIEKVSAGGLNVITNGEITVEKCNVPDDGPANNFQHQANFEVFIQTLISQALDANFISEIIKENDEYFLSHIQAIDDHCIKKKSRFFSKVKWDAHIVKCVETFSSFDVILQSQIGDLRCRLCHDKWSSKILHFVGKSYDQVTLETREPIDIKQTKYAACDDCKDKVALFSNLHHQKYHFFIKCREKVEEMKGGVEDKDSPMILEECLKDTEWMQSLFKQFEDIWQSCDRIR